MPKLFKFPPKIKLSERFKRRQSNKIPLPSYQSRYYNNYRRKATSGMPRWL